MKETLQEKLHAIELGERQQFRNVSVFPLFTKAKPPVKHLVLREAMEKGLITIGEVSASGHVPELKVVNNADMPLLILDGEELFGAKQNRVLNTTVLLKMKTATIIPVSCTEHGRWTYHSETFQDSGFIMSPNIRKVKNRSVQESLRACNEFRSNQGAVWDGIHDQAAAMSVQSPTGAMRDVHEARKADVLDYERYFPCLDEQKGILVAIGGHVVGMDMIMHRASYSILHSKLVRSYLMDAIIQDTCESEGIDKAKAQQFIDDISDCEVNRYKSVGHGWDLRYESRKLFGSALEYRNGMVHMAFFPGNGTGKKDEDGTMAGYSRRASYRRNQR